MSRAVNLQDIVREQTRPILDLLSGTEKEMEDHLRSQESAEARERNLKQEAAEMQPAISELERTLRDSQLKVQEIERQIKELQARLRERQKENERVEADYSTAKGAATDRLRDAARARKEAENWGAKVAEARERIQWYQMRLREERRAALRKHLAALWTRLLEADRKAASGTEARAELDRLNRARHDDPRVAELWEARQEWLRIAQSAGPPPVRETARREVQKIEEDLDNQFPGALKVAAAGPLDELEEVYLCPRAAGDGWKLLLCIPAEICESLDAGESGPTQGLAARIIWAFARAIQNDGGHDEQWSSRFEVQQGYLVMFVDGGPENMKDQETIAVALSGGGRVTFMLSELPTEIRGAMNDETADS